MSIEAMKQVLRVLERLGEGADPRNANDAVDVLRQAIAEAEKQEPVAWLYKIYNGAGYYSLGVGLYKSDIPFAEHAPLYTAPPARKSLTDKQIDEIGESMEAGIRGFMSYWGWRQFARAIERAHGIGD